MQVLSPEAARQVRVNRHAVWVVELGDKQLTVYSYNLKHTLFQGLKFEVDKILAKEHRKMHDQLQAMLQSKAAMHLSAARHLTACPPPGKL